MFLAETAVSFRMAMAAAAGAQQMAKLPTPPSPSGGIGNDLLKAQLGGAKFQQQVLDWTKQSNHLYLTVLFSVIFLWAVYSEKMPMQYRWQLNTTLGRLLLLVLLWIVFLLGGWIPALLFAIAIAMTWANRPLYKPVDVKEGFYGDNIKVTDVDSHMWFVEKALKENPQRIVQDRIQTFAVQEDNTSGTSRTSK